MDDQPELRPEMTRTSRDPEELRKELTAWFGERLPVAAPTEVIGLGTSAANGMSSETSAHARSTSVG